jgi:hypothetical protein
MAAKSKKTGLKWQPEDYNPVVQVALRRHTEKELRQEYTRLRDIAQKRLSRIGATEFAETQTYKNWAGRFPMTKTIKDPKTLALALADVANYVGGGMTLKTMKQQRARSLETLHEHKYSDINEANFKRFGNFMDKYRAAKLDVIYDSKRAVKIFADKPDRVNTSPSRLEELFKADDIKYYKNKGYTFVNKKNYDLFTMWIAIKRNQQIDPAEAKETFENWAKGRTDAV